MAMAASFYKAQDALKMCSEHDHKELTCFCKTCKKFICSSCANTSHNGHDWDLITSIAKERRNETPTLCRKIKNEEQQVCRKKLSGIIDSMKRNRAEDMRNLEEKRIIMVDMVNRIIDQQKRERDDLATNERMTESKCHDLEKKLDYVEKMSTCLDSNIAAYCDYDLLDMENEMLNALREVESYSVDTAASTVKFVPVEINEDMIVKMIGRIEDTSITNVDESVDVIELKTLTEAHDSIRSIAPISDTEAWIGDITQSKIKLLSSRNSNAESRKLTGVDFITLSNGDFIVAGYRTQEIRQVSSGKTERVIFSTKPLHPICISKTMEDDILVTLRDSGDNYKLQPSSRRLVKRMTLGGRILNTYEFKEDGTTRLFTLPYRTAENGNSDICVINRTSENTGELIVLHGDGRVQTTFCSEKDSKFDPRDVACDSKRRIVVLDATNRTVHLLSSDVIFLKYLLSDMSDYSTTMALYQGTLWIGFVEGAVTVYRYTE